jgi:5-carboxymethyl-2-hydroxymuconate isomerase
MPHLEIEYTDNIAGLDAERVLAAAVEALDGVGEYDMASTKARVRRLDVYAVDRPDSGGAFVAVTLSVLPGRSEELLRRTSEAITAAVAGAASYPAGTQVTTQVRELQGYSKVVV